MRRAVTAVAVVAVAAVLSGCGLPEIDPAETVWAVIQAQQAVIGNIPEAELTRARAAITTWRTSAEPRERWRALGVLVEIKTKWCPLRDERSEGEEK